MTPGQTFPMAMAVYGFPDVETAFRALTERPTDPAEAERLLRDVLILQTCVTVLGKPDMKKFVEGSLKVIVSSLTWT
jgi:hypothetical protein